MVQNSAMAKPEREQRAFLLGGWKTQVTVDSCASGSTPSARVRARIRKRGIASQKPQLSGSDLGVMICLEDCDDYRANRDQPGDYDGETGNSWDANHGRVGPAQTRRWRERERTIGRLSSPHDKRYPGSGRLRSRKRSSGQRLRLLRSSINRS